MKALVEVALLGTARQADRAQAALAAEPLVIPSERSSTVIPSERSSTVIPSERSTTVIPSERSESRNPHALPDDTVSLERRVLLAAAVHDTYARAGRLPRTDAEVVSAAADDVAPRCPPAVTALLADLLAIRPRLLLAEALARLGHAGMVVAPALLPDLLDTRDPLLAALLPRVIGERGRWLASLVGGDDWLEDDTLDPVEARRVWEEGPLPRRLLVLRARRRVDPAGAREWLASSWAAESAEHRVFMLDVLGEALDTDDAAFLEQVFTDRSALVRAVAARLLTRLPNGDATYRFDTRADAMLAYEPPSGHGLRARVQKAVGLASVGTLTVRPPEQWDPAWERDGISAKPPKGIGERAFWLTEALALVAPARWTQRFGTDPRTLIRAALKSDWAIHVLQGWSRAAVTVRDQAWAAALWDAWLDDVKVGDATTPMEKSMRGPAMKALHGVMSAGDAESRALALMRRTPAALPIGLPVLVDGVPAPWSAEHSRRFLAELAPLLAAAAAAAQWTPGTWFELLEPIAMRLAPEAFVDALGLERDLSSATTLPPAYRRKLDEFRDVVRLRQRIHEEIPGEPARR